MSSKPSGGAFFEARAVRIGGMFAAVWIAGILGLHSGLSGITQYSVAVYVLDMSGKVVGL